MKSILFLFLIIISITSCTDEAEIVNNNTFEINSISNQNSFLYDTVTVHGIGFDVDEIEIESISDEFTYQVVNQTNTEFTFVPLTILEDSEFALVIGANKTNTIQFEVNPTPNYDTTIVESGEFMMGSITGFSDETPVHKVNITNELIVFSHEVTNLLWHQAMDSVIVNSELRSYPKDSISWNQAVAFANRMSIIYGLAPAYMINGNQVDFDYNSNGWRLPTEAEWEFLCKGNSDTDFSGTGNINEMGFYDSNSGLNKHKIGEKNANDNGLYDLHGNLWEWCWDFYSPSYYSHESQENPSGPSDGTRHVIRGGSYQDGFNYARSTNRSIKKFDLKSIGLRLVRNAN